jgi:ribosomal protein L37AE/L43A
MKYSSYELKYCERCGGLGLRRSRSGLPYCSECEQLMAPFSFKPNAVTAPGQLRRIVFGLGTRMLSRPRAATTPEAVYAS